MQTVLLAAGNGGRLRPLTDATPKPLLPVGPEVLLERAARTAIAAGATDLSVVVPPDDRAFVNTLGDELDGVPISYVVQARPTGTGTAVRLAAKQFDGPFAVLAGDSLYDAASLRRLFDSVPSIGVAPVERTNATSSSPDDTLTVLDETASRRSSPPSPRTVGDGGASAVDAGRIGHVDDGSTLTIRSAARTERAASSDRVETERSGDGAEDDTFAGPDGRLSGAISFPDVIHEWFDDGLGCHGVRQLAVVLERLDREFDVTCVEHDTYLDVDRFEDVFRVTAAVLGDWADANPEPVVDGSVRETARLDGAVRVAAGASVGEEAIVDGPVVIDEGATVSANAYVKGPTYIGPDVTIGHGVVLKHAIVQSDARLGQLCHVAHSILGPGVDFGSGTTVANSQAPEDDASRRAPDLAASADGFRFGVIAGTQATTAPDTTIESGLTLSSWTTTERDERITSDR